MKIVREHINEGIKHLTPRTYEELIKLVPKKFLNFFYEVKEKIDPSVELDIDYNYEETCFRISKNNYHIKIAYNENTEYELDAPGRIEIYARIYDPQFRNNPMEYVNNLKELKEVIKFYDKKYEQANIIFNNGK